MIFSLLIRNRKMDLDKNLKEKKKNKKKKKKKKNNNHCYYKNFSLFT